MTNGTIAQNGRYRSLQSTEQETQAHKDTTLVPNETILLNTDTENNLQISAGIERKKVGHNQSFFHVYSNNRMKGRLHEIEDKESF